MLDHLSKERNAPVMAQRTKALVHRIFKFGRERGLVPLNPAKDLPKIDGNPSRDHFLTEDEIQTFYSVIDTTLDATMASVFKMILLTGQRPAK